MKRENLVRLNYLSGLLCVGKLSNYWSRTENLKFMYAQLMTSAKCESKGFGIGDFTCRLCQNIDEYENLRHLLMDCKEPQILDARWKFIYDACQAVQLYAADISFVQQIRKFTILFSTGSVRFQMDNATIEDYVILKRGTVE
mmetsp:Transcript_12462/g.16773  ORF Transcript_12462/g.16773 Transcript_12462/m.16773 type:complete len:142 (+) Transcript_12462:278-703(+)